MGFDEQPGHPHRDCRPGQHRHHFALAARYATETAGHLHGMGCVVHHRAIGRSHNGKRAHVRDQIVVAETRTAFTHHDLLITGRLGLCHDVGHVGGCQELSLLDIHRFVLSTNVADEVGLPAQKSRRLQYGHYLGYLVERGVFMYVGQYRHFKVGPDLLEYP